MGKMSMNLPSELKGAFVKRPVDANKYTVGTVTLLSLIHI